MALDSKFKIEVHADLTSPLDLSTVSVPLDKVWQVLLGSGAGAGLADRVYHKRRTLAASATEDLDLAGVLTDPLGATITFARIKALFIAADAANVNNVVVGAAASNAWATLLNSTGTLTLRPGTVLAAIAGPADATGWAVTATTADLLRVANSAGGSAVTYDIVAVGCSA